MHQRGNRRAAAALALALALAGLLVGAPFAAQSAVSDPDTAPCPSPAEALTEESLPSGTDVVSCGLVGLIVRQGDVGVEIPPPGQGMIAIIDRTSGIGTQFDVSVSAEGLIEYGTTDDSGIAPSAQEELDLLLNEPTASTPQLIPCNDKANRHKRFKHYSTMTWVFNDASVPSELTKSSAINNIGAAVNNITGATNDCDMPDNVSASASYGGTSGGTSSVQGTTCTAADDKSLVNFGDLAADTLASVCASYYTDRTPYRFHTGDMKINKNDFTWTVKGAAVACSGLYDLQAVVTHEWGHVFGLAHVSESKHPTLTMSSKADPCDSSPRTLGRGDVLGLQARY